MNEYFCNVRVGVKSWLEKDQESLCNHGKILVFADLLWRMSSKIHNITYMLKKSDIVEVIQSITSKQNF